MTTLGKEQLLSVYCSFRLPLAALGVDFAKNQKIYAVVY